MDNKKQPAFFTLLDKFEDYSVTILYMLMIVAIFLQVFTRFVIKYSIPWTEELARYLMAWAVFIGAGIGAKESAHVGIDALVEVLPKKLKGYIKVIALVISMVFSIILIFLSIIMLEFLITTGQTSPAMKLPMWIPYCSVLVGGVLMSIRFGQVAYWKLKELRGQN